MGSFVGVPAMIMPFMIVPFMFMVMSVTASAENEKRCKN